MQETARPGGSHDLRYPAAHLARPDDEHALEPHRGEPTGTRTEPGGVLRVMARVLLLVAVVLGLAACGGKDEAATPTPSTSTTAASSDEAVLASWTRTSASRLFWADPETLEPSDGRTATVPFSFFAAERSPDGGLLAVGADDRGTVEARRRGANARARGDRHRRRGLGRAAPLGEAGSAPRLLAGPSYQAAALDPETQEVVSVESLEGIVLYSQAAGDSLVFLLAQPDPHRPGATRGLRRQQRPLDGAHRDPSRLRATRRAGRGLPDAPVRSRARRRARRQARAGRPGREPRAEVDLETLEVATTTSPSPSPSWAACATGSSLAAEAKSMTGPIATPSGFRMGSSPSAGRSTPPTTRTASP